MRLHRVFALAACAGLLLGGCAAQPEPYAPRPAVVWDDAVPTGPLESDPNVAAVRGYIVERAIAFSTLDFTAPELEAVATPSQIEADAASTWREITIDPAGYGFYTYGPPSMIPVSSAANPDVPDDTIVVGCMAAGIEVSASDPTVNPATITTGRITGWSVSPDKDGTLHAEDLRTFIPHLNQLDHLNETCDLSDAAAAHFDPAPDLGAAASLQPDDVLYANKNWPTP